MLPGVPLLRPGLVETMAGLRDSVVVSPLGLRSKPSTWKTPFLRAISWRMMPKLYTSPAWEPRAGGEAIRRNSGAVHSFSVGQRSGVTGQGAPELKDKGSYISYSISKGLYILLGKEKLASEYNTPLQ